MNGKLLNEFIELFLHEEIRKKSGFSLEKFKEIVKNREYYEYLPMEEYLNEYFDVLGEGSSRIVYLYSSKKVIKLATNTNGTRQNEAEIDLYTNPKLKPLFTKIYDYDKKYLWIISELVKSIKENDFKATCGINFVDFMHNIESIVKHNEFIDDSIFKTQKQKEFFNILVHNIQEGQLMFGDISKIEHWGKTADGHIVLLDYGFTKDVARKYF